MSKFTAPASTRTCEVCKREIATLVDAASGRGDGMCFRGVTPDATAECDAHGRQVKAAPIPNPRPVSAEEREELRRLEAEATPVEGADGYLVDRFGNVFSVDSNWRGYGQRRLAAAPNSHGYLRVRLLFGGRRRSAYVHKLVAEAFLPPRPSRAHQLRHLDGDQLNNAAANLAWGTAKENAEDRDRHGRTARGDRNGARRLALAASAHLDATTGDANGK